jgi:integrase
MAGLKLRGSIWYLTYYANNKKRLVSLETESLQVAKEKRRQFESAQARGSPTSLPSRTPIAEVLSGYVEHIRAIKTAKSAQTDIYYLREMFGPICDGLKITSRKVGPKSRKRPAREGQDRRRRSQVIEAPCFEMISTANIAEFIQAQTLSRGIKPKTANRYREIVSALMNWAMTQRDIRMPGGTNPASAVKRVREAPPEIEFLTLPQVNQQLDALAEHKQMQTMVAMLIFAGLRREELLWLTIDDIDFDTGAYGMIRVRAKTIGGESWMPKTRINRAVPISSDLRAYLDKYRPRTSNHGWFFPNPAGRRWDCDNFSHHLRDINRKAGLHWGCLVYRHTFGSLLAMSNTSLHKISKLMGNSPEICRRHYAALVPEDMTEEVEFARPKPAAPPMQIAQAKSA